MRPFTLNRLVIIGAGAVGGSIGARLHRSGCPVLLVARGSHGQAIRNQGLRLKTPDDSFLAQPAVVESISEVSWQHGDLAMLAVKSQDAENALDELLGSAGVQMPVACASNGMQCEKWAASRFDTVLSMLVWMPATYLVPGEVCIHATGSIGILDAGPYHGDQATELSRQLCARLRDAGFDSECRGDIQRWKAAKWISNLGNTAQALVIDDWRKIATLARAEGETVLEAAGIDRVTSQALHRRTDAVHLAKIAGEKRRGGSTWQSQVRGKSLETPWIEGAMADLAESLGVEAPVNRLLAELARDARETSVDDFLAALVAG